MIADAYSRLRPNVTCHRALNQGFRRTQDEAIKSYSAEVSGVQKIVKLPRNTLTPIAVGRRVDPGIGFYCVHVRHDFQAPPLAQVAAAAGGGVSSLGLVMTSAASV